MVKESIKKIEFIEFKTTTSTIKVIEDNTVRVKPFDDAVLSEESIKEVFSEVDKRKKGVKVKWLMPTAKYGVIDKSAIRFDTRSYHTYNSEAFAIVLMNVSARFLFKFYLKVKRYPIPVKTFKTEEEALVWLRSI